MECSDRRALRLVSRSVLRHGPRPIRRALGLVAGCLIAAVVSASGQHLFEEAFEFQRAGKFDQAVVKYEEGLQADPDNAQAHLYLGDAYNSLKEWERASRHYERAVALNPDGPVGRLAKARLDSLPAPSAAVTALLSSIESTLVTVPAGTYLMGDASGNPDEVPVHKVTVREFRLGKYPITFQQYDVFAKETGRTAPDDRGWGRGKRPVIGLSWDAASAFIAWLNKQGLQRYRLPTEAEWEYAARAGDAPDTMLTQASAAGTAPTDEDADSSTVPVDESPANAWGLHDMTGGVLEWLQDCYQEDYKGAPTDGSAWLAGDCSRRVARGGPARHDPALLRVSARHWHVETFRFGLYGFRLARDL
jgi:formylglycine-generating enzyme required for sulfatase activity